jgi:CRISPR-associated endonuclease/helicase Cas3
MKRKFYAHTLPNTPPSEWQPLKVHLKNVAEHAARFEKPFGGNEWAYLAGLWHDLGKYSDDFQAKLLHENGFDEHVETRPGRVIHSDAGGHLASLKNWGGPDRILSWLIMGHHAGLTDFSADKIGQKALRSRMENPNRSNEILKNVPIEFKEANLPEQKCPSGADPSFFIRMIFSCVVDADFLDTEEFMDPHKSQIRQESYPTLAELSFKLDIYLNEIVANASFTDVNQLRAEVLDQCRKVAECFPAVFSLTVPTGGGKTLSSMAFALRHAMKYGKQRIIYVIPYTSIIEQTAEVFRKIPGFENVVLEHHSSVNDTDESKESYRSRIAAENWDAPIIVTTAVQFFESLYANKTSRCRKLHNIVNSVIIFDEAQCFPPQYLRPIVHAIKELVTYYQVTPVLCTATQPVLTQVDKFDFKFKEGFDHVREIIKSPNLLAERLQRVNISLHRKWPSITSWEELSSEIREYGQSVLCIVNRKEDCRTLYRLLAHEESYHLSTNMCAAHRSIKLKEIKSALDGGKPILVISTSLVEAGVDIDFPIVYRALAGLDSIAQAAGRCNREGRLANLGQTVIFSPMHQPDYIKSPAGITREILSPEKMQKLLIPENYSTFFKQRFWQLGTEALDRKGILTLLKNNFEFYYRTAATEFRLIEDDWQLPLIVPFGDSMQLVDRLIDQPWNSRKIFRRLQRYIIQLPQWLHQQLQAEGHIRVMADYPSVYILENDLLYSNNLGFIPPDEMDDYSPESIII